MCIPGTNKGKKITIIMDKDDEMLILRLQDKNVSDNDIHSCIDIFDTLLTNEAIPALIDFLQYKYRPLWLREAAAKAIANLSDSPIKDKLKILKNQPTRNYSIY